MTISHAAILGTGKYRHGTCTRAPTTTHCQYCSPGSLCCPPGKIAPLPVRSGLALEIYAQIGQVIQMSDVILASVCLINLGRSFGVVSANRGVKCSGCYRIVPHLLYACHIFGYLGFLLGNLSLPNLVVVLIATDAQYLRAIAEERLLASDPAYQAYCLQVHYRLIPGLL